MRQSASPVQAASFGVPAAADADADGVVAVAVPVVVLVVVAVAVVVVVAVGVAVPVPVGVAVATNGFDASADAAPMGGGGSFGVLHAVANEDETSNKSAGARVFMGVAGRYHGSRLAPEASA